MARLVNNLNPSFWVFLLGWTFYLALIFFQTFTAIGALPVSGITWVMLGLFFLLSMWAFSRNSFILSLIVFLAGNYAAFHVYGFYLWHVAEPIGNLVLLLSLPLICNVLAIARHGWHRIVSVDASEEQA